MFARFPEYLHLDRAQDLDVTITGRADGEADRWRVHIDHGECRVEPGDGDARVTIRADAADFLKLVRGKLKVKGDLGFAATLPRLFRIPSAQEE